MVFLCEDILNDTVWKRVDPANGSEYCVCNN